MKLQAYGSLITVATTLISVLPAYAGPLDTYGGSMLDPTTGNPLALCSDKGLGNNTTKEASTSDLENRYKSTYDALNKSAQSDSHSKDDKQSMGGSFMGFGANYSSENKSSDSSSSSNESKLGTSLDTGSINKTSNATETSTVVVGKDCSAVAAAEAARDGAAYQADAMVKSTQIATDGKVKATQIEANQKFMETLLKW
jgi:hypothetical protein